MNGFGTGGQGVVPSPGAGGPRWRGRWMAAAVVIVVVIAGAGVAGVSGAFGAGRPPGTGGSGQGAGTAVVTRQSLTSQTQLNGTLGDAGSYSVVVPPSGSSGPGSGPGSGAGPEAGAGPGATSPAPGAGKTPGTPAPSRSPAPAATPPTPTSTPPPTPAPAPAPTRTPTPTAAPSLSPGSSSPAASPSPGPGLNGSGSGSPQASYSPSWLDTRSWLGTAGSGTSSGSGPGTLTWLPGLGQTIRQGQAAYRVSGRPVVLLYGQVPVYRGLAEGNRGADVSQLNHDLVALGYASRGEVTGAGGFGYFSWQTSTALRHLQAHLGQVRTGRLGLGTAVFLPGPALVTGLGAAAVLGGPATPGSVVATASSRTPVVIIDLDTSMQTEVKAGDRVGITLPSGAATGGVVSQISTVASSSASGPGSGSGPGNGPGPGSGSATVTVTVSLDHPRAAGNLNSAPVTVNITTGSVSDALVVPVTALLAQPGSRYAVEVIGPGGHHHLAAVTPGLFDDAAGKVAVTGDLTPGQRVVAAGS